MAAMPRVIAYSVWLYLGRVFWNYLPYALDRLLAGEISLGELGSFLAYLCRADVGEAECFEDGDAPYQPASSVYVGERDS